MLAKANRFDSKKLRNAARDQQCVSCGTCDGTVVGAHLAPAGHCWGGHKVHDWLIGWLCKECHYSADHGSGRTDYLWRAKMIFRTWLGLFDNGVLEANPVAREFARLISEGVLVVEGDRDFFKTMEGFFERGDIRVIEKTPGKICPQCKTEQAV